MFMEHKGQEEFQRPFLRLFELFDMISVLRVCCSTQPLRTWQHRVYPDTPHAETLVFREQISLTTNWTFSDAS